MALKPENQLEALARVSDLVIVHAESTLNLSQIVEKIKKLGIKVGVALSPETNLPAITSLLGKLDMVLIMSVKPGFSGQEFDPGVLSKVRALRCVKPDLDIEVDGGIKVGTARQAALVGANLLAASSAIFSKPSIEAAIRELMVDATTIFFGCDHGGYELEKAMVAVFESLGYNVIDLGPKEFNKDDDYPDYARLVCQKVREIKGSFGVLLCTTGIGMSIAANKFPDIRAARCLDIEDAEATRKDNDANVICFGHKPVSPEQAKEILMVFFNTPFSGAERHARRIGKIAAIEAENTKIRL